MKVLFFASLRDKLGTGEEELELSSDISTIGQLLDNLSARGEVWSDALAADSLLCAINQETASLDSSLSANDEVAFFPPVTGG